MFHRSFFTVLLILFSSGLVGGKDGLEKGKGLIDFSSIKSVLKNDMLDSSANRRLKQIEEAEKRKRRKAIARYAIPPASEMWSFLSEYWLVKRAPVIQWDFERPDYGLNVSFQNFLEKMGYLEKKFKILVVNTPNLFHFALPSNSNEYIFLLSLPFIRTLDLSKLEISLLMFEDLFRAQMKYFEKFVMSEKLKKQMGGSFHGKKLDIAAYQKILSKYDEMIFKKGFTFQQQYEVTKRVSEILKSDLKLWNIYVNILKKIDKLIKTNELFKNYNKIYPSPELQLGWIVPEKKPVSHD